MNGLFINVMMDREEWPDADRFAMNRRVDMPRSLPVTLEELESGGIPA